MAALPHLSLVSGRRNGAPTPTDEVTELLRRAGAGDEAAFAGLYDATCQLAYGLALRVVRHPELAAQVTQAAYREVWRSAARHDSQRISPTAWILSVVHAQAVAAVRSDDDSSTVPDPGGRDDSAAGHGHTTAGPTVVSLEAQRGQRTLTAARSRLRELLGGPTTLPIG